MGSIPGSNAPSVAGSVSSLINTTLPFSTEVRVVDSRPDVLGTSYVQIQYISFPSYSQVFEPGELVFNDTSPTNNNHFYNAGAPFAGALVGFKELTQVIQHKYKDMDGPSLNQRFRFLGISSSQKQSKRSFSGAIVSERVSVNVSGNANAFDNITIDGANDMAPCLGAPVFILFSKGEVSMKCMKNRAEEGIVKRSQYIGKIISYHGNTSDYQREKKIKPRTSYTDCEICVE